jgi:hypothetical protein
MRIAYALLLCAAVSYGADLTPYALECEARHDPVGIDVSAPRLGWKLKSGQRGDRQTAYQIVAASTAEKLSAGQADIWDSGRVSSPETTWIAYAGPALRPFQRYWWKVRVWDGSGRPSTYSETAAWTMSILTAADWKAAWISPPDHSLRSGPLPLFRKEFTLDKPVRQAIALVAGMGFHELRLNGAKAGDHVLAPAWSNFRATVYYEGLDVTPLLRAGANAIGVTLGNGFYNVAGGRYAKYTGSFGHPRLSMVLHVEFEDGSTRDVTTDDTWRVHDGPVTFSCIYGGEDYDARLELNGWDRPGFDDSTWAHPAGCEAPGGVLRAQFSPALRVQQKFQVVKVTEPKPGTFVYDLGQNFAGWPLLDVTGPAGAQVRMTPGELLDKSGLVSQESSGGPTYFTYTLKGAGVERWSPRFSYYGFRYVQVEAGAAVVRRLEGQFVHLDAARTGSFSCSNERFNRVHGLIDAAVRSNLQHVLTDCPHREKLGWLEQSYLMGPSLLYDWDLRTFLPKIMRDMREAQFANGFIPDIAPEYVAFSRGFRDSPEWGSASVLVPWLDWTWYGDRRSLGESYAAMKGYAGYLGSQAKDGLLTYGLGDWYDIGPGDPGYSQLTPQGVTATATYWQDVRVLEGAARALDREAEAAGFAEQAVGTRNAFQRAFYRTADGTYGTSSQTSLAIPLALGLATADAWPGLIDKLVADIRARQNHTSAGDIGYRYVLAALTLAGRADVVFDLANNPAAPSYAAQLAAGATSLTEAWDANPHSSQNHLMLGHIEEWFYAALAGIRPDADSPGARHVGIEPQPCGDLRWVKAAWESPWGPVSVDWHIEGATFFLKVGIPPGMVADVRLPGGPLQHVDSGEYEFSRAWRIQK